MSVSDIIIKVIGVVLAIAGLALILSAVGIGFLGVAFSPSWLEVLIGVALIAFGIWIIRGGNITP